MMRTLGALCIAVMVIGSFAAVLLYRQPSREALLIEAFPAALDPQLTECEPANELTADERSIAQLIPDAFLRSTAQIPMDAEYGTALGTLRKAQVALRTVELLWFEKQDLLAARERDVRIAVARWKRVQTERFVFLFRHRKRTATAESALAEAVRQRDSARQAVSIVATEIAILRSKRNQFERRTAEVSAERDSRNPILIDSLGYRGTLVQRNTIVLRFTDEASAEEIMAFLKKQRLAVRGGIARIGLFIVELQRTEREATIDGDATRLRAVIEVIRKTGIVDAAVQNTLLSPDIGPASPTVATSPQTHDWSTSPLLTSRFPQAWNFNDSWRKATIKVGVLDQGFRMLTVKSDLVAPPLCSSNTHFHGTAVASIIGATFDNKIGMDGAGGPFPMLFTCAPDAPPPCDITVEHCEKWTDRGRQMACYIKGLETLIHLSGPEVINASIGYNWSKICVVPIQNSDVRDLVAEQGKMVKAVMKGIPAVLVATAGNDSDRARNDVQPAIWASPFNWAALEPKSPLSNILVVEGLRADGVNHLNVSNGNGSIAAIGEKLFCMTPRENEYNIFPSGTSGAAPLVSSTIVLMLANNGTFDIAKITTALRLGKSQPLDAFAAVHSYATDPDHDLADVASSNGRLVPDGRIDRADFEAFKSVCQQNLTDFDSAVSRMNLDGKSGVTKEDLEVIIRAWPSLTPAQAAELRKEAACRM